MKLLEKLQTKKSNQLLFGLAFLAILNLLIPVFFLNSPLGMGIEGDSLDYRIPFVQMISKYKSLPHLPWTYIDDFPALSEILMVLFSWLGLGYRILPVLGYISFSFICYKTGRLVLSPIYALLGTLQVMTMSAVVTQDNAVMIDLFAAMFLSSAIYFLLKRGLSKELHSKNSICIGLFLGLCLSARYTLIAPVFGSVFLVFILDALLSKEKKYVKALSQSALVLLVCFFVYSPFFWRNYHWNGNPFFPLFTNVLPSPNMSEEHYNKIFKMVSRHGFGANILDFLLLPFRFAFYKNAFDYSLGPLFLMYLPLFLLGLKNAKLKEMNWHLVFSVFYLLAWFLVSRHARFLYHFYPLLVFGSLLTFSQLKNLKYQKAFVMFFIVLCVMGTWKHWKKHDEEKNGLAYLKLDRQAAAWANENLSKGSKMLFLKREGNVFLYHFDFLYGPDHIYASSHPLEEDFKNIYLVDSNCSLKEFSNRKLKSIYNKNTGDCIYAF